jgi:hypothetical protein
MVMAPRLGRRSRGAIALAAAVTTAGCGGTQTPPAVSLVLTAPTSGSVVNVSEIRVFGTVSPSSAAVDVAGRRVHTAHGEFARWVALRAGLSHIKIVATAAGYAPADMNIAVRSSPSRPHTQSPSSAGGTTSNQTEPTPSEARYATASRGAFLRTCEAAAGAAAAASKCECALSYLEAHVSERTLALAERAVLKSEATLPPWFREAGVACRKA